MGSLQARELTQTKLALKLFVQARLREMGKPGAWMHEDDHRHPISPTGTADNRRRGTIGYGGDGMSSGGAGSDAVDASMQKRVWRHKQHCLDGAGVSSAGRDSIPCSPSGSGDGGGSSGSDESLGSSESEGSGEESSEEETVMLAEDLCQLIAAHGNACTFVSSRTSISSFGMRVSTNTLSAWRLCVTRDNQTGTK